MYKKETSNYLENAWKNEKMYDQFECDMREATDKKGSWNWLRKSALKIEKEAVLFAA